MEFKKQTKQNTKTRAKEKGRERKKTHKTDSQYRDQTDGYQKGDCCEGELNR